MSARIVGLGVVASALALAAIGVLGPRPTPRDARPVPSGPAPTSGVVETPPLPDDPVARALALAERASGLVIDVDGRPVAGARVLARLPDGTASTTTTDAKGRFAVAVPPTDGVGGVLVEASTPDGRRGASFGFRRGEAADLSVVVGPRRTVRVRILGADGRPVANADVAWTVLGRGWGFEWGRSPRATAADGTAVLDVLRTPDSTCLVGLDPLVFPGHGATSVPDDGRATTEVVVQLADEPAPPSTPPPAGDVDLAGTLLEAGRPVAGATVTAAGPSPLPDVVTDPQGRFRLRGRGVAPRAILVRRDPSVVTWASLERGPTIDLEPVAKLAGRVVDGGGRPLAGVKVTDFVQATSTSAEGTFSLWVGYAEVEIGFRAAGFLPVRRKLAPASGPTEIVMAPGGQVRGYVVGEDGAGLVGVRGRVEGATADATFVTGGDGSFRAALAGGPWSFTFEAEGYTPVTVRDVEPDSVVPTVVLRRSTTK